MCMQCVGAVGTALQAATLVGGPIVYAGYRRARSVLGLSDTSVAARAADGHTTSAAPDRIRPTSTATASSQNWVPEQRTHSARASSVVSGTW